MPLAAAAAAEIVLPVSPFNQQSDLHHGMSAPSYIVQQTQKIPTLYRLPPKPAIPAQRLWRQTLNHGQMRLLSAILGVQNDQRINFSILGIAAVTL
jgi:hypothetical protein